MTDVTPTGPTESSETTEPTETTDPTDSSARRAAPLHLFGDDFARDPAPHYARARQTAPIVRALIHEDVEVSLVVRYHTALKVLHHPEVSKDSRPWFDERERRGLPVPPVLEMMRARPNVLYEDGEEHRRLITAVRDSLAGLDPATLRRMAGEVANGLIDGFAERGEADLLGDFAAPLPLRMFFRMFGVPEELGQRIQRLTAAVFDAGADAADANARLTAAWQELVALKGREPGEDVVSWLMAHRNSSDDDGEIINQLLLVMGAGTEPEQNLIASTLLQLLTNDEDYGRVVSGSQRITDALETTLLDYAPMANYSTYYPRRDLVVDGIRLLAWQPVMISFGSCNQDEALRGDGGGRDEGDRDEGGRDGDGCPHGNGPQDGAHGSTHGTRSGTRAHLAWSAGPHECPAWSIAVMMATVAVETLLDRLPEIELAVPRAELAWRPGPYQRGLAALPVAFPAQPVRREDVSENHTSAKGSDVWTPRTAPTDSTSPDRTYTAKPGTSAPSGPRRVWNSLRAWWHGQSRGTTSSNDS